MFGDWIAAINRRLPTADYGTRHSFVDTAPWLALLSAALGLLLGGRGLALISALPRLPSVLLFSPLTLLIIVSPLLALAAFFGLRDRKRWGWALFFTSVLIDFVASLLRLDLFGLAFGALFTYFLLQTYTEYGGRRYW
jgi:hypothetical protein